MERESPRRGTGVEFDPAAAIAPQLHAILRGMVVRNVLPPGSRISESEIARQFTVSRQPVREAFIKLAEERLIEIRPQRATVVRRIVPDEVLDARFVREAVEADIVRLLAAAPDAALVGELRRQLDEQRKVAHSTPGEFIEVDEAFHRTLAQGAGKGRVWEIIQGLKSQMDRVRFLSFELVPHDRLIDQHRDIVEALARGEAAAAEAALRRHLRAILQDLPEIMRANPNAFAAAGGEAPETPSLQGSTQRRTQ